MVDVPENAILAEDGTPILTEDGQFILIEGGALITSTTNLRLPIDYVLARGARYYKHTVTGELRLGSKYTFKAAIGAMRGSEIRQLSKEKPSFVSRTTTTPWKD